MNFMKGAFCFATRRTTYVYFKLFIHSKSGIIACHIILKGLGRSDIDFVFNPELSIFSSSLYSLIPTSVYFHQLRFLDQEYILFVFNKN